MTERQHTTATADEEVDGWGLDSFPASDPPQNW